MGIKQHLMALAGVGRQPEGATGAQLHVGYLHAVIDAAHHHAFLAPVKLEGFAQVELQWHEGFDVFAGVSAPGTDKVRHSAIAANVAAGPDLQKQRPCAAPVLFVSTGIGFEGKFEFRSKGIQFAKALGPHVLGYLDFIWGLQPLLQRVARQPRALRYGPYRHLVAHMHAPYLA